MIEMQSQNLGRCRSFLVEQSEALGAGGVASGRAVKCGAIPLGAFRFCNDTHDAEG